MSVNKISEAILGVGVDDTTIDLFESQYPVPTGVSYNSYVILDEKTAVLDTVDARATEPWLENLTEALAGRKPDYLVVSHMEPDHGANIAKLAALYPEMQVVGNAKTFLYMDQFFGADAIAKERRVVVKDGESLSLGAHTLTFVFAPWGTGRRSWSAMRAARRCCSPRMASVALALWQSLTKRPTGPAKPAATT